MPALPRYQTQARDVIDQAVIGAVGSGGGGTRWAIMVDRQWHAAPQLERVGSGRLRVDPFDEPRHSDPPIQQENHSSERLFTRRGSRAAARARWDTSRTDRP